MYGKTFENTFLKHKKLLNEFLDQSQDQIINDDPNWENNVDWNIIANNVNFNSTTSLEDFFSLNENDKRRSGEYINHITDRFKQDFGNLPDAIKKSSREYYSLFLKDYTIGKLRFHNLGSNNDKLKGYVAINAGNHGGKTYRSVGKIFQDEKNPNLKHIKWFFIGGHAQYDDLLKRLNKNK